MKKLNLKLMLIGVSLLTLAACKPATKDGVRVLTSTQRNDVVSTGSGTGISNNCTAGQSNVGTIFDQTMTGGATFEQRVKLFLSATTAPENIGTISSNPTDNTGVRFQGVIKLDSSGNVVLNDSKLSLKVYDSFTTGEVLPIPVTINTAHSGQFNPQTHTGYVIFKDGYGEVRFDGRFDNQYFQGTVSYINTVTVVSGVSPASGELGQFYISTCGMIQ